MNDEAELTCEVIDDYADLAALTDEWTRLCAACPSATPFQRPEWLLAWIRQLGPAQPWILAVWRRERLLGLAPLFVYTRVDADGPRRLLAVLGAGESDYLEILIAPSHERRVLAVMLETLAARRDRWDAWEFDQLRPTVSPLRPDLLAPGWSLRVLAEFTSPSLALPASVDALAERVPSSHLERFHYYRRRAERRGDLRLERATSHTCARLLAELVDLHQARWRERGEPGALADAKVRALHRDAARGFATAEALGLYALTLDDRVIACVYGFEHRSTFYCYLSGFDPAAAALNPGTLVIGLVIEAAIRRGITRFDFLRGDEPYKYWWGAEDYRVVRVAVIPPARGSSSSRA